MDFGYFDISDSCNLKFAEYEQKGLYIILPDSSRIILTKESIEKKIQEFWNDSVNLSPEIKNSAEFQRCAFCPLRNKGDFCDALRPILPFLEIVDKFVSYDKVEAVYKGNEEKLYHVAQTTMQEALHFVSVLSLTRYCQAGRKYWKYYLGIIPLMSAEELASRLYLNIYWNCKGKKEEIDKLIQEFRDDIKATSRNQVARLNLICKNDSFMNAFVHAQIITEFLSMDIDKVLVQLFDSFEKSM